MNGTYIVTLGFAQVGQTEKTSAIVMLSSAVRADRVLSANEQIINFLFYIRLTVRADRNSNFPPPQSPAVVCHSNWTI